MRAEEGGGRGGIGEGEFTTSVNLMSALFWLLKAGGYSARKAA